MRKSYEEILSFIQGKTDNDIAERKNDMEEQQEQEERKHLETLDRKIERLQENNALAEELSTLLDERHLERKTERVKQALYDAYVESERSLDEIIDLIRNANEWI